jgi:hypothetical protein
MMKVTIRSSFARRHRESLNGNVLAAVHFGGQEYPTWILVQGTEERQ